MSGVHRLCDRNLLTWASQEQNQDKVAGAPGLPLAPRLQAEEKFKSQFVGPLPYSHRPQVTPGCSLPSRGPAVLTCPPRCSLGPLLGGARSPPWCSLRGGQPSSLGISCHLGSEPKPCLLPGQPPQSGSLPGPQVGPRSPESSGKLAKTPRSSVRQTGNAAQDT